MSNQVTRYTRHRLVLISALWLITALLPASIHGEETQSKPARQQPLLVRARQGDTPATIAQRYLNDASKGWMIHEYNDTKIFSGGEAVLVPVVPFRPGGLAPDGYQTVPVLAFSDIGAAAGKRNRLPPAAFNEQMQWLKSNGFTTITPAQLVGFLEFSEQLPRRSVLITADTDSPTFNDVAAPVLTALGFTATVFVAVDRVNEKGAMTWIQLKRLGQEGFTIGCRGRFGRSLTRRKKGQSFKANFQWIESELRYAKNKMETHLGQPCRFLAYPRGRTNQLVSAMAAKLGFSAAFKLSPGDTPFFANRFSIHRTVIDHRIGLDQFGSRLNTFIAADLNR